MFPFLSVAESPEATGKKEQKALTVGQQHALASKQIQHRFQKAQQSDCLVGAAVSLTGAAMTEREAQCIFTIHM